MQLSSRVLSGLNTNGGMIFLGVFNRSSMMQQHPSFPFKICVACTCVYVFATGCVFSVGIILCPCIFGAHVLISQITLRIVTFVLCKRIITGSDYPKNMYLDLEKSFSAWRATNLTSSVSSHVLKRISDVSTHQHRWVSIYPHPS